MVSVLLARHAGNANRWKAIMQINYRDIESGVVHAPPFAGQDFVLCGNAMEGDNLSDVGEVEETTDPIDCDVCIRMIRFCKSLRLPTKRALDGAKRTAQKGSVSGKRSGRSPRQ